MKKPYAIQIERDVLEDFFEVAEAAHMDPAKYAAVWVSKLSELKPEFALDAFACIPKEFFKAKVGRPATATATAKRKLAKITADNSQEHVAAVAG